MGAGLKVSASSFFDFYELIECFVQLRVIKSSTARRGPDFRKPLELGPEIKSARDNLGQFLPSSDVTSLV